MTENDPRFLTAVKKTLAHEGGYVDHPADPGGSTNYGISQRFLYSIKDRRDPRDLTKDDAIALYKEHFWDANDYGSLDLIIGSKVFDLAVNMGARQTHRLLQRAVRAAGVNIRDDGFIGPKTLDALSKVDSITVAACLKSEAAGYYRTLVAKNPTRKAFLRGWLRRAYS